MTELERLRIVIEAETKPLQQELKKVNNSLGGLEKKTAQTAGKMKASFAKIAVGVAAVGYAVKKAVTSIGSMAKESQAVQSQTANLSRTLGSSAQDYISWAKKGATAYGISKAAAIKYGNTFGAMASLFESDSSKLGGLTQAMMQTSAVVASKTGRTMDDVLDRIRSGLMGNTEAIEDLNIFVNQSAITQTEAYKKIAGTASWNQLTMSQQKAILYYGILEQANTRYGTSIDPVMQKQLQLSAQLANLRTNLGNAFLPVVNVIIPVLQHLVGWLNVAATYVRAFFELLFGAQPKSNVEETASNTAKSMGSAANSAGDVASGMNKGAKAAQKIKNLLAGFDQLNILPEETEDGGGGGISLPSTTDWGMEGLETSANSFTSAFENISTTINEAKENISSFWERFKKGFKDLLPLIAGIAAGFGLIKLVDLITNGDGVVNVLGDILKKLPLIGKHPAIGSLHKALGTILGPIDDILFGIVSIGTKIGTALGFTGSAAVAAGFAAIAAVIALVVAALVDFYRKSEDFRNIVSTAIEGVGEVFDNIWNTVLKPIFDVFMATLNLVWEQGIKPLWDSFVNFIGAIATLLLNIWNSVLQPLINFIIDVVGPIIAVVIGGVILVFGAFFTAVSIVIGAILDILGGLINWVAGFFAGTWKDVLGRIGGLFTGLWNAISPIIGWISARLGELGGWVSTTFGPMFKVGMDFVAGVFKNIWNTISGIVGGIIQIIGGIITFITGVFTGNWSKAWDGVKNIFNGVWNAIKSYISGVWNFILSLFNVGGKIFDGIVGAIGGVFKTIVNALISGINKVIATPFNVVNGLLNTIRGIGVLGVKPFKGLWNYNPLPVPQIPKLATGTNYVQREGLAYIHEGEAVVPKKYNPAAGGGEEQVALLQEQNRLLRALVEKDTNVVLDGTKVNKKLDKASTRQVKAYGY